MRFQPKYKIKKGDEVVVIAGANKDLTTPKKVMAVLADAHNPKVKVEGVAIATKHLKPNAQNPQGTIVKEEAFIAMSNVMLWDAKEGRGVRITKERTDKGVNRVSKKSKEVIK